MGNKRYINSSFPPKAILNYVPNLLPQMNKRRSFVPSLTCGMSPTWQTRFVISNVDNVIVSWDQDWPPRISWHMISSVEVASGGLERPDCQCDACVGRKKWSRPSGFIAWAEWAVDIGGKRGKTNENSLELSFQVIRRLCGDKYLFSKTIIHSDIQAFFFFFFLTSVYSSPFFLTLVLSFYDL